MKLLLDSDIDSSIRRVTSVRDSPTPSTPHVPVPAAALAYDSDGIIVYCQMVDKVGAIYAKGRHRQWAKAVRELALGGKENYFEATDDSRKLAKIVVVLKMNEFGYGGAFSTSISSGSCRPSPLSREAKEQKLVRDNRAEDWTPTEMSRKYKMFERIDPEFYAAVRVRYPMPNDLRHVPLSTLTNLTTHIFVSWEQQQAELGVAVGPKTVGEAYSGDESKIVEVLGMLTSRLEKIESAIEYQRLGGASAAPPKNRRGKGLDGYRAAAHPTPQVGFDKKDMRALPLCHSCGREGVGKKYHEYTHCPFGGRAVSGSAAYAMPVDDEGAAETMHALALCHIFLVAAGEGEDAFAAAVQEYGAPAVLAGWESDGIDVSAYGFSVSGRRRGGGVLAELHGLIDQVKAMEEKVVPHCGAGAAVSTIPAGCAAHVCIPTEEFPGGVDRVPLRRPVPSVTLGAPISAVACSFGRSDASFAELEEKSEAPPIEEMFVDSEDEEFPPSIFEESFVGAPGYASAVRPQQVVGCGAPPFDLRPHFVMLTCFLGLLAFGIAGVAADFGDIGIDEIDNNINSIATESPVMCVGQLCLHPGFDSLSPVVQERLIMHVLCSALTAEPQAFCHGGMPAEASGYGGVATTV
ncbi:hypothetical protein CYMTET_39692 [Cymbomonas tetramitiformis]|uniref:Uncharacterized protein n=1 Tax=Cymbomonas tetramitiformis TaxID=36881 RepID=A0AAE0C9M6_9CHLO|nr:hypothetical protein CYMTET_39692 [Cymbomonas tetramitiformis]